MMAASQTVVRTEAQTHGPVDITDLPAAIVLAALYNNQYVDGIGGRFPADGNMSIKQAQSILTIDGPNVGVLRGRPIHVHFGAWDEGRLVFDPTQYNAVRGEGAAAAVIQYLSDFLDDELPELIKDLGDQLL